MEKEVRTKALTFRLSECEYQKLLVMAQKEDRTPSAILRRLIRGAKNGSDEPTHVGDGQNE